MVMLFEEKLSEWCGTEDFELLYRGSRDCFGASGFHRLCDNKGKTLVLVKNTSGHVFVTLLLFIGQVLAGHKIINHN